VKDVRAKFYPVMVQRWKEKEFMELRMSGSMTVMQYSSKLMELSRLVHEFVSPRRLAISRFEEI